jgi:alpha-galactosidase
MPNPNRTGLIWPYRVMQRALDAAPRDIVYSLCQYGMGSVWEWGTFVDGNCWRTTGDITDSWRSLSGIGFQQAGLHIHAGPGIGTIPTCWWLARSAGARTSARPA